jgi:hypothetical protein
VVSVERLRFSGSSPDEAIRSYEGEVVYDEERLTAYPFVLSELAAHLIEGLNWEKTELAGADMSVAFKEFVGPVLQALLASAEWIFPDLESARGALSEVLDEIAR